MLMPGQSGGSLFRFGFQRLTSALGSFPLAGLSSRYLRLKLFTCSIMGESLRMYFSLLRYGHGQTR